MTEAVTKGEVYATTDFITKLTLGNIRKKEKFSTSKNLNYPPKIINRINNLRILSEKIDELNKTESVLPEKMAEVSKLKPFMLRVILGLLVQERMIINKAAELKRLAGDKLTPHVADEEVKKIMNPLTKTWEKHDRKVGELIELVGGDEQELTKMVNEKVSKGSIIKEMPIKGRKGVVKKAELSVKISYIEKNAEEIIKFVKLPVAIPSGRSEQDKIKVANYYFLLLFKKFLKRISMIGREVEVIFESYNNLIESGFLEAVKEIQEANKKAIKKIKEFSERLKSMPL